MQRLRLRALAQCYVGVAETCHLRNSRLRLGLRCCDAALAALRAVLGAKCADASTAAAGVSVSGGVCNGDIGDYGSSGGGIDRTGEAGAAAAAAPALPRARDGIVRADEAGVEEAGVDHDHDRDEGDDDDDTDHRQRLQEHRSCWLLACRAVDAKARIHLLQPNGRAAAVEDLRQYLRMAHHLAAEHSSGEGADKGADKWAVNKGAAKGGIGTGDRGDSGDSSVSRGRGGRGGGKRSSGRKPGGWDNDADETVAAVLLADPLRKAKELLRVVLRQMKNRGEAWPE